MPKKIENVRELLLEETKRQMLEKGYKPEQILGDFQKFEADQAALAGRAADMVGMTAEAAISLWDKFIGS